MTRPLILALLLISKLATAYESVDVNCQEELKKNIEAGESRRVYRYFRDDLGHEYFGYILIQDGLESGEMVHSRNCPIEQKEKANAR